MWYREDTCYLPPPPPKKMAEQNKQNKKNKQTEKNKETLGKLRIVRQIYHKNSSSIS